MDNPLRTRRPLDAWVDNPQTIEFAGKVADFPGLAEVLENDLAGVASEHQPPGWRELPVTGNLTLRSDGFANREVLLDGSVVAHLTTVCQRCLQPFDWALETALSYRLVSAADESQVADNPEREVWELSDESVTPQDIVEEAIVLAMPLAPMHIDSDDCRRDERDNESRAEAKNLTRPFADLRSQIDDSNRNKR